MEHEGGDILISKQWHELAPQIAEVVTKKKKVDNATIVDTGNTSLWQIESVIEVPYVDLNVEMPDIHSFRKHQRQDVEIGQP